MKYTFALFSLLLIALPGCEHPPEVSELSINDIEHLPFMDAYRYWRQEMGTFAEKPSPEGPYIIPTGGVTDPKTGKFTPSNFAALQCRLGKEAHLHESFLMKELAADASVHMILESSQHLCEKYGIHSMALVLLAPGQGYMTRSNNGYAPEAQQDLWLKAMSTANSQPDSARDAASPISRVRADST